MRIFLIANAVLAALIARPALAADMATKAPILPAASPAYNWSGFYLGLNAGGDWGNSDPSSTAAPFNALVLPQLQAAGAQGIRTSGFTGGVQGGYNWQSGNLVLGVEGDFEYFRSAGTVTPPVTLPGTLGTVNTSVSTNWLATLRPRLGFTTGNWLIYATGGLAVTQLHASWASSFFSFGGVLQSTGFQSASSTEAGWTVGGGVEAALQSNWSIGLEYLYVKFPNITATGAADPVASPIIIFTQTANLASNIVRVRLDKKF
jgi:outer membrane immunogenic protein